MDHIERSFSATVVFGFVVLVTGIIMLAVLRGYALSNSMADEQCGAP